MKILKNGIVISLALASWLAVAQEIVPPPPIAIAPAASGRMEKEIMAGEFAVTPFRLYRITLRGRMIPGPLPASPRMTIRYFDVAGNDIEVTEKQLGFDPANRTVTATGMTPSGEFILQYDGQAGQRQVKPIKGRIYLSIPLSDRERCLTVNRIKVEDNPSGTPSGGSSSGVTAAEPESGVQYATNMAPNPSFEILRAGRPEGWHYIGQDQSRLTNDTYTGNQAILLPAGATGHWESDMLELKSATILQLVYRTKFSRHAGPHGQLDHVRVEFFRRDGNNRYVLSAPLRRVEFPWGDFVIKRQYGSYLTVVVPRLRVPPGATHCRLTIAVQNELHHAIGLLVANWGDVAVDDIMLYPVADERTDFSRGDSVYAPLLVGGSGMIPPFMAVGNKRENSAVAYGVRTPDANLYFASECRTPTITLAVGNLLAVSRDLTLRCRIFDQDGNFAGNLIRTMHCGPYGLQTVTIPPAEKLRYGTYYIEAEIFEGQSPVGGGSCRFGWLSRRPVIAMAERHHPEYPFDMHPRYLNGGNPVDDPAMADYELRQMSLLGVRGIRLATNYRHCDWSSPEKSRCFGAPPSRSM